MFFGVCAWSCASTLSNLSGTILDDSSATIDGASVAVFDVDGKPFQTSSSAGNFSLAGVPEGEYLFKVEKSGKEPVLGTVRLAGDGARIINVVMLNTTTQDDEAVGAGTALRKSARPSRSSAKPPKVKPAQVKKKVTPLYPAAERKAGIRGTVRIAMIILPDGSVDDLVAISAPNSNLAVAALMAVRNWRYSPTYLDDQPVETNLIVDVNFEH